ncbi:MAG: cysteine-rich CWC family protein [Burkholderiaceae bacterium]|nr:MAG: cysteine-rich CWC family protein [Burkholderiaceae bacterium]
MPHATDTNRCPLCGQANQCAVAAGLPAQDCWCMHTPVSREALARLAPGQRGRSCICPLCAREMPDDGAQAAAPPGPQPI